jgi:hypothetical protein
MTVAIGSGVPWEIWRVPSPAWHVLAFPPGPGDGHNGAMTVLRIDRFTVEPDDAGELRARYAALSDVAAPHSRA